MNCLLSSISKIGCCFIAYRPSCLFYDLVRNWKNNFESGVELIKMHRNQVR